jgi:hypothetical protein
MSTNIRRCLSYAPRGHNAAMITSRYVSKHVDRVPVVNFKYQLTAEPSPRCVHPGRASALATFSYGLSRYELDRMPFRQTYFSFQFPTHLIFESCLYLCALLYALVHKLIPSRLLPHHLKHIQFWFCKSMPAAGTVSVN